MIAAALPNTNLLAKSGGRTAGAIDAKTFRRLTKAQDYVANGQQEDALEILKELGKKRLLSDYAKAQVWNYQGYIYALDEQYVLAIEAYNKVLEQKDVPEVLIQNARFIIGQLYFQLAQYQAAIDSLVLWVESAKSDRSTAWVLIAQAHFQLSQYAKALDSINRAITRQKSKAAQIPENWLQLQAALYFSNEDIKNTVKVYEVLVQDYPNTLYLKQLAGLYGELELDRQRLTLFDSVYEHGALTEGKEQLNLAYMYQEQGVPFKAGKVLEKALHEGVIEEDLKNLRLLGGFWSQAGQHKDAIAAYQRAAALSDDGEIYAQLASVFYQAADYRACVDAANAATEKGGLESPGQNFMLQGLSLINLDKPEQALQAFRQAKDFKRHFSSAKEWERYTLTQIR